MRVLYVNQTAQMGGAERSLLDLLRGIGDRIEPLVACPHGALAETVEALGAEHLPITGTRASFRLHPRHTSRGLAEIARSSLEVRRLVDRVGPDLVHANTTRASLLALLGRRRSAPPVIAHIRDRAPEGRFSRFVLATIGRRADLVVANSAFVARQFDGLPLRRPVRVLYNPVDLDPFDPGTADGRRVRRELGIAEEAVVLSVVAQLTPLKGQDVAIEATAAAEGCEVVLLLVGSAKFTGPQTKFDNLAFERRMHDLVEELAIADRVRFLGERSDVPDVLAATDVLLMPFWRDGFGRVAVEAMAMGVPVVASEVGGPAEIVRQGVDGLLLPPREPQAWGRTLKGLARSKEKRVSMGSQGIERAMDFGLEAQSASALRLYGELSARDE